MLVRLIKGIAGRRAPLEPQTAAVVFDPDTPSVLNVGGGSKSIPIPGHYQDWQHVLLDIDPGPNVDVVMDARSLINAAPAQFDAIYCSHNLEHYYQHDAARVLAGFVHVLKPEGFAEIRVPDMLAVFRHMVTTGLDINDVLYTSAAGPITVHDVVYGWGNQIESSGVDFYAHKCGFTLKSLGALLERSGFGQAVLFESSGGFELKALAFKGAAPTEAQRALLSL